MIFPHISNLLAPVRHVDINRLCPKCLYNELLTMANGFLHALKKSGQTLPPGLMPNLALPVHRQVIFINVEFPVCEGEIVQTETDRAENTKRIERQLRQIYN